jgi:hypothetical protein
MDRAELSLLYGEPTLPRRRRLPTMRASAAALLGLVALAAIAGWTRTAAPVIVDLAVAKTSSSGSASIRLDLELTPFVSERAPTDPVPWSAAVLVPGSQHLVPAFPPQVVVPPHAPRADEILWTIATNGARTLEGVKTWRRFLRDGSPCLITLPEKHAGPARQLAKKVGSMCAIKVHRKASYETQAAESLLHAVEMARAHHTGIKWIVIADRCVAGRSIPSPADARWAVTRMSSTLLPFAAAQQAPRRWRRAARRFAGWWPDRVVRAPRCVAHLILNSVGPR